MHRTPGFAIRYANPRHPLPAPDRGEEYDLVSAFYDYGPAGASAEIAIGDYRLYLSELKFINWVRQCLLLAEQILSGDLDQSDLLRRSMPDLPARSHAHYWIVADAPAHAPVLVFAVCGDDVLIYTRTAVDEDGLTLRTDRRDRTEPVIVPRRLVLDEIRAFLTAYLDDMVADLPFLAEDELYRRHRARIAALS